MHDDEIETGLKSADEAERRRAVRYLAEHEARPAFFQALTERIADADEHTRFWALSALVWRYPEQLRAHAASVTPLLMARLLDNAGTVTDRAIWALNIVGETALPPLLAAMQAPQARLRLMAAIALARSYQVHAATAAALPALLRLLDDEDDSVRFTALDLVLALTPLRTPPAGTLQNVDFEPLYARLQPLAEAFSRHPNTHYQEWASRLLALLVNR